MNYLGKVGRDRVAFTHINFAEFPCIPFPITTR
jgi:hypothetical protein